MIIACVIGLGQRGYSLLRGVLLKNTDITIVAVCDLYDDRIDFHFNFKEESKTLSLKASDKSSRTTFSLPPESNYPNFCVNRNSFGFFVFINKSDKISLIEFWVN